MMVIPDIGGHLGFKSLEKPSLSWFSTKKKKKEKKLHFKHSFSLIFF